jgi:hypothetical protein
MAGSGFWDQSIITETPKMAIILQVNYTPGPEQQSDAALIEIAEQISSSVIGLQWKVWISNETDRLRGGIYLFDDVETARAWGEGRLREMLTAIGGTNISMKYFDVDKKLSVITRMPIRKGRIAA